MPSELEREQQYVTGLYERLEELRERTAAALAVVRASVSNDPSARTERDAFAALHEDRLRQLRAVEERLCFGRLDLEDGAKRYIGRLGLSDDEQVPLLMDWRAPASEPFYRATAQEPLGVVRRRHLSTKGRRVTHLEDDVLDVDALRRDADARGETVRVEGEGALLAALNEARTGRMRDIVATIQAEQDHVIRSPLPGVLVVQGGPGTGKTAVALHRAAYLLYTYRDRVERSGVLLVGPNPVFLRYIEQVLPSLGETGVLTATVGTLFPGVDAVAAEDPRVAALKGDLRMADVVATAVRRRQRVPSRHLRLDVDGTPVVLDPRVVAGARAKARRSGKPHNLARLVFVREVLSGLAGQLAAALGVEVSDDNRASLLDELRESRDVRREVNLCWMPLTPQQLLADLYSDKHRLEAASREYLSDDERALLHRERGAAWTPADVPLLDEAAELLGEDDSATRAAERRAAAEHRREVDYARQVLRSTGAGAGMVSAETLADRFASSAAVGTVAEQAAGDRTWAFGHVVVDEAQELSPMAWRLLMRRCPSRSMTVVGDVAQTGALGGARSWGDVLDPYVAGRWRLSELTVNYRTPRQIMDVATAVLASSGADVHPPRSVRDADLPPTVVRDPRLAAAEPDVDAVAASLAGPLAGELELLGEGRLAVLVPRALGAPVLAALGRLTADGELSSDAEDLNAPVVLLTATQAKGLEFDAVLLVEPARIVAESPRGVNDLYVALTRPTQRLVVVHGRPLPPGFDVLPAAEGPAA